MPSDKRHTLWREDVDNTGTADRRPNGLKSLEVNMLPHQDIQVHLLWSGHVYISRFSLSVCFANPEYVDSFDSWYPMALTLLLDLTGALETTVILLHDMIAHISPKWIEVESIAREKLLCFSTCWPRVESLISQIHFYWWALTCSHDIHSQFVQSGSKWKASKGKHYCAWILYFKLASSGITHEWDRFFFIDGRSHDIHWQSDSKLVPVVRDYRGGD